MIDVRVRLERSVLGGVLVWPDLLDELNLVDEFFSDALSRRVFERVLFLRRSGVVVDVLGVASGLSGDAVQWVFECQADAPASSVAVRFHARELRALWAKQRLQVLGETLGNEATNPEVEVSELSNKVLSVVDEVNASNSSLQVSYPDRFHFDYVRLMTENVPYLPTAWNRLNRVIGGWRAGGMYVIAGRPGQGKTIVALQAAAALAFQQKHVLYFSLEMPATQIQHRLLAQVLEIDVSQIADRNLSFEVFRDGVTMRADDYVDLARDRLPVSLGVVAVSRLTPQLLRAYISVAAKRAPVDAVFIDYLGLMDDDTQHRDKTAKVSSISNQLKRIALDLNIPVVAAVQLNREVESRSDSKPQLSDLRDSGSIEQDADVVMLIFRKRRATDPDDSNGSDFFLRVAKNRHGAVGAAKFLAQDYYSRIVEA